MKVYEVDGILNSKNYTLNLANGYSFEEPDFYEQETDLYAFSGYIRYGGRLDFVVTKFYLSNCYYSDDVPMKIELVGDINE